MKPNQTILYRANNIIQIMTPNRHLLFKKFQRWDGN